MITDQIAFHSTITNNNTIKNKLKSNKNDIIINVLTQLY